MNGYESISGRATFIDGIRFIHGWRCIDRSIDQTLLVSILLQHNRQYLVDGTVNDTVKQTS
jgi:hypothetical protein